jgi:hypothetical protein
MFQRFVQVLQADDSDDAQRDALRRFWTRVAPRPGLAGTVPVEPRPDAGVVDLAQWASNRRIER